MSDKILQSVIEITQQRDLDSLEYSLVATLAEMVPATSISIYKFTDEAGTEVAEEVVQLSISYGADNEQKYTWSPAPLVISDDQQLESCLNNQEPFIYKLKDDLIRLLVPIVCEGSTVGALSIFSYHDLSQFKTLIEAFVKIYGNYLVIFNESERDKLTGLYNRRTFDNKLRRLFKTQKLRTRLSMKLPDVANRRITKPESTAWLAIFDIDHFKRINDSFGHIFGDEVLLTISQKLKECFRGSDLLFRIGGEEFVVILEPVTQQSAGQLFENFRQKIAVHNFPQIDAVTISIGYAKIMEKDFPPEILERADKALYYAKEHGRNCTYSYEKLIKEELLEPPKRSGGIDLF
jgi:diguanylate cyclase (GGDEF)-like protein